MRGRTWITRAGRCLFAVAGGLVIAALPACSGTLGDPYGTGPDGKLPGEEEVTTGEVASRLRFPRLSHAQWERTIADLFQLDGPTGLSASFTPDPLGGKAFD